AANPGDASVGDVDTAPTFDPRAPLAAAADAAPVVDAPEPAVQGDTFPPIDDFSTIVLPTSAPAPSAPDDPSREPTLGPKVGFTEPSSRPSAPQFGDDDDRPRVPQPTSAPMPAAQVHAATPLTPTQPTQAPPAPPAAPAAPAAAAMAAAAVATPTAPVTGIATDPFDDDAQDDAGAGSSPGVPDGGDGGDGAGDDAFDAAKARLIDRVAGFDPPAGATPAETADLKADLQQMIDRFVPLPGESTADALAALHAQYDDRVHVFNQDQKIDALIQETRRDNAREQAQQHSSQGDDAPATGTSPASGTSATNAGDAPDDVPTMNVPPVDAGQGMPTQPVPAEDQAPPPVELHPDNDVTNAIRTEATQILQQMESDRRATFGGGIQDPQTTMQYYANQQVHMAQLQQLVSDQQAVALKTDGGMPSDALLDRINAATVGLVAQANSAMMQATQQYASATGIPQIFTPPPLVPIPVVVPDLPDPASIPDPEPAAAAEPPSAAYDAVASQVAAINQAMAQQAGANGLPFTPIQVPMDPTDAAPDLAAVNAGVAAQVAGANAQMASMSAAMNRPIVQIPIPTITLPDDVPTDTTSDAGQAAGPGPDPGSGGAMGESGPDAPSAAFDAVATQVAAINQAMAQQAGANGLPFTPIQVPMDPTDAAPDLAAVNAAVAAQVASANAQMASMASALNLPPVQIPTPTIVLPDGLGDTAIPSAGEAQDDGDDDAFPVGQTPGTAAPLAGPSVAASQATYGAADQATYGTAETAAFQGAGASSGDAPDPDPGTSGAADVATYGTANVAAANTAGLSDADQPSNGAISDGPGVAYTQGGAANLAAGQSGFAEAASALAANEGGDASDVDYRNAVLDGDPGIIDLPDPFDAQAAHAESQSIPDDNTGPASVPTSSPAPDDESNASDEAGKVLVVDSEAFAEHIIVDNATTAFGAAQPATALLGMVPAGTDVLGPSNLGEGEDSGSSEYGNDGDDGGSP
ncbi:MAG: hypothetical protein JWN39_3356, partial [Ilumatobacteraceae bacterium]|nr:hypothetical protein [Ilumatobacteraceae bacterium]